MRNVSLILLAWLSLILCLNHEVCIATGISKGISQTRWCTTRVGFGGISNEAQTASLLHTLSVVPTWPRWLSGLETFKGWISSNHAMLVMWAVVSPWGWDGQQEMDDVRGGGGGQRSCLLDVSSSHAQRWEWAVRTPSHSLLNVLFHFQPIFTTLDLTVLSSFHLIDPLLRSVLCQSTDNATYVVNCAGHFFSSHQFAAICFPPNARNLKQFVDSLNVKHNSN